MLLRHALAALLVLMFYTHTQAQSWQWAARMGGTWSDPNNFSPDESIKSMATDAQGNVYLAGLVGTPASFNGVPLVTKGLLDIIIAKLDCMGNTVWVKTAGSAGVDEAHGLALDGLGHLYVSGSLTASFSQPCTFLDTTFTNDTRDMFLAKLDTSGKLIWLQTAGPGASTLLTTGKKIQIDSKGMINVSGNGGISTSGTFFPGFPYIPPAFVARFDTAGNINRYFNYSPSPSYLIYDFKLGPNDEMYACGILVTDSVTFGNTTLHRMSTNTDLLLCKWDSAGVFQWVRQWGQPNVATFATAFGLDFLGNDVVLTGRTLSFLIDGISGDSIIFNNAQAGISFFPFVARFSSDGTLKWTASPNTPWNSMSTGGIVTQPNGSSYISGLFQSNITFGASSFTSTSNKDMFLAAVDSGGNWISATHIAGSGNREEPECMARDSQGNIYVGGGIDGNFTLNNVNYNSLGGLTDAFVAKWGIVCPTALPAQPWGATAAGGLLVYPNPTQAAAGTASIAIAHSALSQGGTLTVYNMLGNVMLAQQVVTGNSTAHLLLPHCPPGMYLVRFANAHTQLTAKLLVVE